MNSIGGIFIFLYFSNYVLNLHFLLKLMRVDSDNFVLYLIFVRLRQPVVWFNIVGYLNLVQSRQLVIPPIYAPNLGDARAQVQLGTEQFEHLGQPLP